MTPTTKTGRALLCADFPDLNRRHPRLGAILAIEAEAVAAERARIRAGVERLRSRFDMDDGVNVRTIDRAAVLAIVDPPMG